MAGGPSDDHEGTRESDAVDRACQGMRSMLRLGSAWHDIESQITAITQKGLDPRNFILCTDDGHSGTLVHEGHMNRAVRHAIACGCDPLIAIQMATIKTATHFGLERELGSIAPGRRVDVVLSSDLHVVPVDRVFALGVSAANGGRLTVECPHQDWPNDARATVHMGRAKTVEDFAIMAPAGAVEVTARVIGVVENQAPTRALTVGLTITVGKAEAQGDTAQIALAERHRATGQVVNAFVWGLGTRGKRPSPRLWRMTAATGLAWGQAVPRCIGSKPVNGSGRRHFPMARQQGGGAV